MKIYVAYDHNGYDLAKYLVENMAAEGYEIKDIIDNLDPSDDYPDVAKILAKKLKQEDSYGVAICGSGQGICMALNRHSWIRAAAKIVDIDTAQQTRLHNHANCICFGAWDLDFIKAHEVLKIFLATQPDTAERHVRRVKKMQKMGLK